MKIAFWSNVNDYGMVSSNLAAISVASVIRFPYKIVTFENHLKYNSLGRAYLGNNHPPMLHDVGTNYYEGDGIEGLTRKIYRGNYEPRAIHRYIKDVIHKHLYYIPKNRVVHTEIFDYEFNYCFIQLQHILRSYVDICLIDTASYNCLSTKTILDQADLVVVNLNPNPDFLEDFFLNYSSLIPKAILIINSNNNRSIHKRSAMLLRKHEIPRGDICILPMNEGYQEAFLYGNVVEYIYSNYHCNKDNPNYLFIQALKRSAYTMIKKAEYLCLNEKTGK
ncbi:MAG TPA: hypothetical protein GXZ28_10245 [Clostridiales bacterium]|nr:hypothetical protein [Clostridiales bacterium]